MPSNVVYKLKMENNLETRKHKNAMHFCRDRVLIIPQYVLHSADCSCSAVLRIVYEEFTALTSEGRHQCQSFDGSPRSRRSSSFSCLMIAKSSFIRRCNCWPCWRDGKNGTTPFIVSGRVWSSDWSTVDTNCTIVPILD